MADSYEGGGQGRIYINGRLLAEATKTSVNAQSNDQLVKTLHKGAAGFSDGAGETSGSIETAVPRKGYELDFVQAVTSKATLQLVIVNGGRRHQTWCRFLNAKWDNAVDSPVLLSADWQGGELKSVGG